MSFLSLLLIQPKTLCFLKPILSMHDLLQSVVCACVMIYQYDKEKHSTMIHFWNICVWVFCLSFDITWYCRGCQISKRFSTNLSIQCITCSGEQNALYRGCVAISATIENESLNSDSQSKKGNNTHLQIHISFSSKSFSIKKKRACIRNK